MINALWLTSDKLGCGTYRCYIPALSLQESKVADNEFLFHNQVTEPTPSDLDGKHVVVFQRAVGTLYIDMMKECARREIATVFEMDDNLFDVPRHNPASWFWRRKGIMKILHQQLDLADRVIVSTKPLLSRVLQEMKWGGDDHKVRLCPNHLHPAVWGRSVWGPVKPYDNQHTVIGWQGSSTHDTDFKMALPALARIIKERPDVVLRFLGCVPLSIRGVIPENRFQWTKGVEMARYPATLRYVNYDIGIAPVTDSLFNRCKSNIKWLEYSALGIPCVASKVYPYERSIEQGVTGFVAETEEEWYEYLTRLLNDPFLRQTIGTQAQQHVWQAHSQNQQAPKWAEALLSVTRRESLEDLVGGTHAVDTKLGGSAGTGDGDGSGPAAGESGDPLG